LLQLNLLPGFHCNTGISKLMKMNLLLAILLGPLNFFRFSIREGLIAVIIPPGLFVALMFALFDGNFHEAAHYRKELAIWGGAYWVLCIIASLISHHEQRQRALTAPLEMQADNSIKQWLQQNPGKTLNDYFSKFPV